MVDFTYGMKGNFGINQPQPSVIQPQQGPQVNQAIEIANSLPVFKMPEAVSRSLDAISNILNNPEITGFDLKRGLINFFTFLSGAAVGTLSGIALVGLTTSPIGWTLAIGALILSVSAANRHGGKNDVLQALRYAGAGFLFAGGVSFLGAANAIYKTPIEFFNSGYLFPGLLSMLTGQAMAMVFAFHDTGVK